MKKNIIITAIIIIITFSCVLIGYNTYKNYRIKHAVKIVKLTTSEIEVYSQVTVKDLIKEINGKLLNNPQVDTKDIGKKIINFEYTTDTGIQVPYSFEINVVDSTPPVISQIENYSVIVDSEDNIEKKLFCGDNYDEHPKCYIEGEYDLKKIGEYKLKFVGKDSSNNLSSHDFILNVKEISKEKSNSSEKIKTTDFQDIITKYKTSKTKIGIDISHWQGNIDFEKVKKAGVEFVYIRVGRGDGIGKKYVTDSKFKQNIEGFNKVGIPVGAYFYSSANSKADAIKEAKWVLKQIKKYKVDLEIAFDWENWTMFQEYDLNFHKLTELSNAFNMVVKNSGYKGMLYSSKNYLENIWESVEYPVWLAHYTTETNYQGNYKVWQLCSNGKVDGIADNLVDINIRYD